MTSTTNALSSDSTTTSASANRQAAKPPKNANFAWASALFGTAVGAGILFLPLSAGAFGFWPLLTATVLIGPITYLSHLAYVRIISHAPVKSADLLTALSSYFGRNAGTALSLFYLFMLFPVLLVYAVSITNTVDSFIINQLGGPALPRPLLAFLCVGALTLALVFGEKIMLAAAQATVIPLLIALGAFSLYLIPQWDVSSFLEVTSDNTFLGSMVLILPVLVFSFTFIGSASQFAVSMQNTHGPGSQQAEDKQRQVIMLTTALLTIFTMFFVWSCALALGADGMAQAAESNLPVLSYFANITDTPLLAFVTPVIAICAISSSYFGVALGAREGLQFLAGRLAPKATGKLSPAGFNTATYAFIFVIALFVAVVEPGVMDLITVAGGLLITLFQFVLPMVTIYTVAKLKPLRTPAANGVVILFGAVVLISTIWGFF